MPRYEIRGVEVDFPFDAYDCQLVYMEKVITALQQGSNALLESPTGTGKTLCLLCATLAWRRTRVALAQFANSTNRGGIGYENPDGGGTATAEIEGKLKMAAGWGPTSGGRMDTGGGAATAVPRVIYASRTHTQLSQTIKELKATGYTPKVCVLASREQLCINAEVQQVESNAAKTALCRAKTSNRSCHHQIQLEQSRAERMAAPREIRDIEDLVKYGLETRVCPYYLAREDQEEAELTVLPYNYLFDASMRRAQKIDITNAIVIVDEAHNLEKHAEETASFDLTPIILANCIDDVGKVMALDDSTFGGEDQLTREDLAVFKTILLDLEEHLGQVDLGRNSEEGKAFPGEFIYDLFNKAALCFDTSDQVLNVVTRLVAILTTSGSKQTRGRTSLSTFSDILRTAFSAEMRGRQAAGSSVTRHYRVYIKETAPPGGKRKTKGGKSTDWDAPDPAQPAVNAAKPRTLSFWCFSPGIAIKEFEAHGTHSIILTSGTLHPLESFAAELSIKLPVRLQNAHVIAANQLWCGVVRKGPGGHTLNSSYANRSDPGYQRDLGNAIVNFCRIVPNGVLVFFPSYGVMRACIGTWQGGDPGKTVWDRIRQYKAAVIEPQDKHEFSAAMSEFYARVNDPRTKGAVFFAVCRGKVSEGLDFANENGRAVIITGLPYPPFKDPRVVLKREHCDRELRESPSGISGSNWYHQQSARAVNQAIGRVIRHRHDYGAIIFCDERFASPKSIEQLPNWIQPSVKVCNKFGESQGALTKFFKELAQDAVLRDATTKLTERAAAAQGSAAHTSLPPADGVGGVPRVRASAGVSRRLSDSGSAATASFRLSSVTASPTEQPSTVEKIRSIRPPPRKAGNLLQSLNEQDRSQAAVGMGSLKRSSSSSTETTEKAHKLFDPNWTDAGSATADVTPQPRAEKRRRNLYKPDQHTTTPADGALPPAPKTGADSISKAEAFTKRLRELLGKEGTRHWHVILTSFSKSAKKLPDMETLLADARGLFTPYGKTAEREMLRDLRVVFSRKPKLLVLYDTALNCPPKQDPATSAADTNALTSRKQQEPIDEAVLSRSTDPAAATSVTVLKVGSSTPDADAMPSSASPPRAAHEQQPDQGGQGGGSARCPGCGKKPKTPFRSRACRHICCYSCWIAAREKGGSLCPDSQCKVRFHKKDMEKMFFS